MSNREISNSDDVIDSRDVIARIAELESERDDYTHDDDGNLTNADWAADNPDEAAELTALTALAEEAEQYAADWKYGEALVRDSYFTEYAMDLLEDSGDLPKDLPHYVVIDREATARNIQMDYTAIEYDGVTYWIR
jgi:hypothetical protein